MPNNDGVDSNVRENLSIRRQGGGESITNCAVPLFSDMGVKEVPTPMLHGTIEEKSSLIKCFRLIPSNLYVRCFRISFI